MSTTPMPSAVRSGGGSDFSSTPGPAAGDPLSATYSFVPSGLAAIPRGRFPNGIVPTTFPAATSMIDKSPDCSLVTYRPRAGGGGGAAGAGALVDAGCGAAPPHAAAPAAKAINTKATADRWCVMRENLSLRKRGGARLGAHLVFAARPDPPLARPDKFS